MAMPYNKLWLEELYDRYPIATKYRFGVVIDPAAVEEVFIQAREESRISPSTVEALENSADWLHTTWWPELSRNMKQSVAIPRDLRDEQSQAEAIRRLYEPLRHIECVSVILRFFQPRYFGILSVPVSSLLNLPQNTNAIEYYSRYLLNLRNIKKYCGGPDTKTVAQVDMALWTASHLPDEPECTALRRTMYNDRYLMELRFANLLQGLRLDSKAQYLILAQAFREVDRLMSSLIAARLFEQLILKLGRTWKDGETEPGALSRSLDGNSTLVAIGIKRGQLQRAWTFRNRAVHETLTRIDLNELLLTTEKLLQITEGL
jgi:hypothetical protein